MRVASFASLSGKELTKETVEHLLKDILQEEGRQSITIEQIQRRVAEHFDVRLADMTSKRRPASIRAAAQPRRSAIGMLPRISRSVISSSGAAAASAGALAMTLSPGESIAVPGKLRSKDCR